MEEDAVSALLGSSLQDGALSYHQGTDLERNQSGAMQMDSSVASEDRDLHSKNVLKAVKLKIIATDELIRKFIGLKQRHEKVYRLYKYQEKLIADLEETNRDHVKDKELLKEKLAVEKAGNQGFENTIAQFVARLEEAEQKMVVAQTRAKEAEETVTQLKKELLDKNKKIERLEKRLDSTKLLGAPCRARSCGKGGRQRKLSAADSGITEGASLPQYCAEQIPSQPVAAVQVGASSEEPEDGEGFVDVLDEAVVASTPPVDPRDTTAATTDIRAHLLDTSEERHHPVCLPEVDGVKSPDGSLREHADATTTEECKGKKGQQRRYTASMEPKVVDVGADRTDDTSKVTHSGVPSGMADAPEGMFDMPMLALDGPSHSSTPGQVCVATDDECSEAAKESHDERGSERRKGKVVRRKWAARRSKRGRRRPKRTKAPQAPPTKEEGLYQENVGQQEVVKGQKEMTEGHRKVDEAMMDAGSHTEHCSGMAALMADFQLSDGSSDEEGESPVDGSGTTPSGDLPVQEEVKVCGSDSEGDIDSGRATGSAAPSVISEGGPSPNVAECEIAMEMETNDCHRVVHSDSRLGCNLDEYNSEDAIPTDYEDFQQSDAELLLSNKREENAPSIELSSDLSVPHSPSPPHHRCSRYSLEEIFASMLPLGRLSPIPTDPPNSGLEWSKEDDGKTDVSHPCPSGSDQMDVTGRPSHLCKESYPRLPQSSCSSIDCEQDDSASKQSDVSPSALLHSPKSKDISAQQPRQAMKKKSAPSPVLSSQPRARQCTLPTAKHPSAVAVLPLLPSATRLRTRDILLSSCSRGSPSQPAPLLSDPHSGRDRRKGKAGVGKSMVLKGISAPLVGKGQPLIECEVEKSSVAVEKCRDEESGAVVVSLLQSGGGKDNPPQNVRGRCSPLESEVGKEQPVAPLATEEPLCSVSEYLCDEEDGKVSPPTSLNASTLVAAPSTSAVAGGAACRDLGPVDSSEQGATSTADTSASIEIGADEASSSNGGLAAGPKGVEVIGVLESSGSNEMAGEEEEEMEDGEVGSSDDEDPSPVCDQVYASCGSSDEATRGMTTRSSQVRGEGGSKGPPPQAVEGIGSKRTATPRSLEACTTLLGPSAKKQKLSELPIETAFVAVAWLDPLVPKDSSSSGKVHSAKRGGGAKRGKGQKEPNYVRSTLQVLEKGKVGVCETFSLLASEENVKSRKKLIAGFQLCLYNYKPSWAKLQQKLKNKLDTISSLTIGKTKDTRPLTPQEDPNSTEFLPCLLPFEAQLMWLVLQLSCYYGNQAQVGGANGQKGVYLVEFKEMLYEMIKKESKRFHLKCALIRLYVSCCRLLQGFREHVQLLSCELLSSCEPLMERRLPMIQSIACVWPLALTKLKDHTTMLKNGRYIPSVLEPLMLTHVPELVVVHTLWKDSPDLFTNMVFKSLFLLCHWRQNTPDSLKAVAIGLVGVLHLSPNVTMVTPPPRGPWERPRLSVTGTRTVNLLHLACNAIGWKWTSDVLIRTQLWPLLQSWNKKDGSALREATLVGICSFFGMIRPLGVEYDSSAGPGSNCLQLLQKVLVSLLVKATTEQDREMSLAVQLTIAESLLALCPPGSAMATEAGSVLTTWLQHNSKKHSWFAATVGQQYLFPVQQIASSQHQFVQFNEPTY